MNVYIDSGNTNVLQKTIIIRFVDGVPSNLSEFKAFMDSSVFGLPLWLFSILLLFFGGLILVTKFEGNDIPLYVTFIIIVIIAILVVRFVI